jgi:hypothetical protein
MCMIINSYVESKQFYLNVVRLRLRLRRRRNLVYLLG